VNNIPCTKCDKKNMKVAYKPLERVTIADTQFQQVTIIDDVGDVADVADVANTDAENPDPPVENPKQPNKIVEFIKKPFVIVGTIAVVIIALLVSFGGSKKTKKYS